MENQENLKMVVHEIDVPLILRHFIEDAIERSCVVKLPNGLRYTSQEDLLDHYIQTRGTLRGCHDPDGSLPVELKISTSMFRNLHKIDLTENFSCGILESQGQLLPVWRIKGGLLACLTYQTGNERSFCAKVINRNILKSSVVLYSFGTSDVVVKVLSNLTLNVTTLLWVEDDADALYNLHPLKDSDPDELNNVVYHDKDELGVVGEIEGEILAGIFKIKLSLTDNHRFQFREGQRELNTLWQFKLIHQPKTTPVFLPNELLCTHPDELEEKLLSADSHSLPAEDWQEMAESRFMMFSNLSCIVCSKKLIENCFLGSENGLMVKILPVSSSKVSITFAASTQAFLYEVFGQTTTIEISLETGYCYCGTLCCCRIVGSEILFFPTHLVPQLHFLNMAFFNSSTFMLSKELLRISSEEDGLSHFLSSSSLEGRLKRFFQSEVLVEFASSKKMSESKEVNSFLIESMTKLAESESNWVDSNDIHGSDTFKKPLQTHAMASLARKLDDLPETDEIRLYNDSIRELLSLLPCASPDLKEEKEQIRSFIRGSDAWLIKKRCRCSREMCVTSKRAEMFIWPDKLEEKK